MRNRICVVNELGGIGNLKAERELGMMTEKYIIPERYVI